MINIFELIPSIDKQQLETAINAIRARLIDKNLEEKLYYLEQLKTDNEYHRIFLKFLAADFCISERKNFLGINILNSLLENPQVSSLLNILPEFYLMILSYAYVQLKQAGKDLEARKLYQKIISVSFTEAYLLHKQIGESHA